MKREKIIEIMDRLIEYCLYGLVLFIPVSNRRIEIFASLAILFFFIKKALQPEFRFVKNQTHLYLLFFFIFNILSLTNSGPYLKKSLEALIFEWAEYIFIFLMVEDTLITPKRLKNTLTILIVIGLVVGFDAIFQRFSGFDFLKQKSLIQIKEGLFGVTGPFKHYNDFAVYLVCILLMVVALFLGSLKKKIYCVSLISCIVLLGLCLLFTFSRGGWLGFLAGSLLMLVLSRKWKIILPTLFIFLLILILVPVIRERAVFTFQLGGDAGRLAMWKSAWAMIKESPFLGKGIGTFMPHFPHYTKGSGVWHAHNCYLQMWAETGIFSLLSFLLFVGSVFYRGIRTFKRVSLSTQSLILLGLICGTFGFLVHSFFDTHFYELQLPVLFWFMLGLTVSTQRIISP